MEKQNQHTYVNIKKCSENSYYNVTITRTYNNIFGRECKKVQKIPFIFRTVEIAKDFVSILPDVIEKTSIKKYKCSGCPLCYVAYETYKLTVGKYKVYIRWWDVDRKSGAFRNISDRTTVKTCDKVIGSFVRNIAISDYGDITYDCEYEKLTSLINKLEEDYGIIKYHPTEYNYELFEQ